MGGFVEIGDGGNGGNVGDGMKILGHDVIVGRGEGNDLVFVFVVITHRCGLRIYENSAVPPPAGIRQG